MEQNYIIRNDLEAWTNQSSRKLVRWNTIDICNICRWWRYCRMIWRSLSCPSMSSRSSKTRRSTLTTRPMVSPCCGPPDLSTFVRAAHVVLLTCHWSSPGESYLFDSQSLVGFSKNHVIASNISIQTRLPPKCVETQFF